MMVSMAALQVFVVRFFFQGARKGTFIPFALRGLAGLGRWLRLEYNAFAFSFLFLIGMGYETNVSARLRVMRMKSII